MFEQRVKIMEEEVTNLRIANARLVLAVDHLSATLMKLDGTVLDLRDAMNRGRGALVVIVGVSTLLGGAISAGVELLLRR